MRILLAEDEVSLSKALKVILERNNYSVDQVYDGEEALSFLSADNYDCLILDLMMPKVDGITVLKTMRKEGNMLPVIILTAKSEVDDKVLGLDSGANDYITKPFNSRELLARIRAITRSKENNEGDSILKMGNTILMRDTFILKTDSGETRLQSKEFQILELLMQNKNKLISTERLMEKIWGFDSEAEINVVWVYISNLRKKLASLDSNVEIKATRNAGYTLEERND
ncbi:response regulator transcription factor [Ezakiella coagulans]|uniref:response regulator transcription factor n=1 Tax=Ezakiella coagulans TaxID=46507 RepID=UPI002014AC48|nr:response regulator transcription factor [Ezakiella coagulans]UQK60180.1 response regulator transcription factor [Ezakiella coagulans]